MHALLKFAHASMQFSDTTAQQRTDVERIFDRGYDAFTGTEAGHGSGKLLDLIEAAAKRHGYRIAKPSRYDTFVAVKDTLIHSDWEAGGEFAIWRSSRHNPTPPGRWGDKGVVWASWNMGPTYGRVALGSVHYLTHRGAGPALKAATDKQYSQVIGKWAAEHGARSDLAFIGGDFNLRDRDHDVFKGQPLTTCWDDLKVWPNTGHGNIDALARYDKDTRVKCVGARVIDDRLLFLNTDHYLIEAEYRVEPLPKKR